MGKNIFVKLLAIVIVFASICNGNSTKYKDLFPLSPENYCDGPNGEEGLNTAIKEFIDLIPVATVLKIFLCGVIENEEMEMFIEYIGDPEFYKIVDLVQSSFEFQDILDYICTKLYFDVYYYLKFIANLLDNPPIPKVIPLISNENSDKSPKEVFQEIVDAIPVQEIYEAYFRLANHDLYFRMFLMKIRSTDFWNIYERVEALPEYEKFLKKLQNWGFDTDYITRVTMEFFLMKTYLLP